MRKLKLVSIFCLTCMLSGCFGGGLVQDGKSFTAHGGTFNFFTMKWDLANGLGTSASAIAESHVPSGTTVTNVNTNPHWRSMTFPGIILGFFNEFIIGADYCQIGGTSR